MVKLHYLYSVRFSTLKGFRVSDDGRVPSRGRRERQPWKINPDRLLEVVKYAPLNFAYYIIEWWIITDAVARHRDAYFHCYRLGYSRTDGDE
jgi:hypothetical protein